MIARLRPLSKQWLWPRPLYIRDPTLTPVPSTCPFIIWSLWKSTRDTTQPPTAPRSQTFLKFYKLLRLVKRLLLLGIKKREHVRYHLHLLSIPALAFDTRHLPIFQLKILNMANYINWMLRPGARFVNGFCNDTAST